MVLSGGECPATAHRGFVCVHTPRESQFRVDVSMFQCFSGSRLPVVWVTLDNFGLGLYPEWKNGFEWSGVSGDRESGVRVRTHTSRIEVSRDSGVAIATRRVPFASFLGPWDTGGGGAKS